MASVRKLSRDRGKKGAAYHIQFLDHRGKRRTTRGCPDKGVSEAKAAKIETLVQRVKVGIADERELEAFLGHDRSDRCEAVANEYEASLKRKGNTEKHVRLTMSRVRAVLDGAGFQTLAELDADLAEAFIAKLAVEEKLGARTYNHYLQAIDAFGNWLAHPKRRRLPHNPFAGISRRNAATDVRHARRALSPEEIAKLIATARDSKRKWQRYDGPTRARLYYLSYMTGLRKGEIASLTPQSFRLDGERPTVTIEAQHSKHRRKDVLPLHAELAAELRVWLEGMEPSEPLFPKLAQRKAYVMVQGDLEEAGIPYKTEEGLADFHAAGRHTHITQLLRSGASIAEAKELARHSDVRMTMRYTHIGLDDQSRAVNRLQSPAAGSKRDDHPDTHSEGGEDGGCLHNVCNPGVAGGPDGSRDDSACPPEGTAKKRKNPCKNRGFDAAFQKPAEDVADWQKVEAAGIEPASRDRSTGASTCVVS
ncbi:Tyrosine recombinase XerC [Planctomycetes bacterium K2D]|nr:Tyrosine recombinase XerC [Planctomycetes bacterium K2D]